MEPFRFLALEPVGAEVKEDQDGDELEGVGGEARYHEPDVDTKGGQDQEDGMNEKAGRHETKYSVLTSESESSILISVRGKYVYFTEITFGTN